MASNLVVMAGIVVFYSFIMWGIGGLYAEDSEYSVNTNSSYSAESSLKNNIFGVSTYQDEKIPAIINLLVITPMNFLLIGCVFYFFRGVA